MGMRLRLGASTYSWWHFTPERVPIERCLDEAVEFGLDGIEILHQQMAGEERSYVQGLKRRAFTLGLDLYALSIHQDFVWPEPERRREQVEHTLRCIDLAHELGCGGIRLNSGRWGTAGSFDELMAARGVETPLPGYTDDNAFCWCIESIEQCLPRAEEQGVVLALENHWGLTRNAAGVNRIVAALDSPWLAVCLDFGNFLEVPYDELAAIAPGAVLVHAKTYFGGGEWYTLDLDYSRIAGILQAAGYQGYLSIEFEGKAPAGEGLPRSVALLREAFAGT